MTASVLIGQLAILAVLVSLTICIHGAAMLIVLKHSARRLSAMGEDPARLARITSIIAVIFVMMTAHLGEMAAWGLAIYLLGLIPDPFDSFLYSMESYTTLGPKDARLASTLEVDDGLACRHGHFNVRVVDGDSDEHPEPHCFRHPSASLSSSQKVPY